MFKRILFATDGSSTSEHAQQAVINLAGYGSQVRVITVVSTPSETEPSPSSMLLAREPWPRNELTDSIGERESSLIIEAGEGLLESCKTKLTEAGLSVDTQLLQVGQAHADVSTAILDAASGWAADVIVVGTHGRSGLQRVLLGSVAETLVRHCTVPVLLVRQPQAA